MTDSEHAKTLFLREKYQEAAALFLEGAEEGDAECAFNYGYCLRYGYGVAKNCKEAKSFYGFARNLPGGDAYYELAMLYLHGTGVTQNFKKCFSYMLAAAEAGCIEAQLYVGNVYTTGCVFEPDIDGITRIPFHKPVMRRADTYYLTGATEEQLDEEEEKRFSVVDADAREAFLWFRTAALGDPTYAAELVAKGKYLFAKCFVDGFGVECNYKIAVQLMLDAGRSGSEDAVAYLSEQGVPEALLSDPNFGKRSKE